MRSPPACPPARPPARPRFTSAQNVGRWPAAGKGGARQQLADDAQGVDDSQVLVVVLVRLHKNHEVGHVLELDVPELDGGVLERGLWRGRCWRASRRQSRAAQRCRGAGVARRRWLACCPGRGGHTQGRARGIARPPPPEATRAQANAALAATREIPMPVAARLRHAARVQVDDDDGGQRRWNSRSQGGWNNLCELELLDRRHVLDVGKVLHRTLCRRVGGSVQSKHTHTPRARARTRACRILTPRRMGLCANTRLAHTPRQSVPDTSSAAPWPRRTAGAGAVSCHATIATLNAPALLRGLCKV